MAMKRGPRSTTIKKRDSSSDLSPPPPGEPVNYGESIHDGVSGRSSPEERGRALAQEDGDGITTPARGSNKRKRIAYIEDNTNETSTQPLKKAPAGKARTPKKIKVKHEEQVEVTITKSGETNSTIINDQPVATATTRRSKANGKNEAETMPLSARTVRHAYHIGAHVSASGGVHNAVTNAVHIGANAFALFLKSQRKWQNPALDEGVASQWQHACSHHSYSSGSHVVPHGSYLVNLAHTDPARTQQAYGSFLDDLQRCERLNIGLYNFHPGNVQGVSRSEALSHLASNLNRAHKQTKGVVTLLENMAAGGNVIGTTFEDIADVIDQVDDKSRVGMCLDTCHAFAAGYDLRDSAALQETLIKLDEVVGLEYLRALHLNDSKAPYRSHRDLHANIGTGFLGLRAFHAIMNEPRLRGLPMVLETPIEVYDSEGNPVKDAKGKGNKEDKQIWADEIKLLESLTGMDVGSDHFAGLESALAAKGAKERARVQDQVDRKNATAKLKTYRSSGAKKKGKRGKKADEDESLNAGDG